MRLAVLTGIEPATSALTGRRALHCSTEPGDSEAGSLPSIPRTDFAMNATVAVINDSDFMGASVSTLLLIGEGIQTSIFSNEGLAQTGDYSSHFISFHLTT